ncbi:MAG: TldD/PmbA family protein, partial [Deltaproteobacteria bacterium]|nr:TldD/PmbA family protein [Deltaproteobacteria bacterium]
MKNPDLLALARRCVDLAKKKGADEAEAYVENGRNLDVTARDGAVETVKQSESMGLGLRVFTGRKLGFGSTSDLRADRLEPFVERVLALAKVTAQDEYNRLPA